MHPVQDDEHQCPCSPPPRPSAHSTPPFPLWPNHQHVCNSPSLKKTFFHPPRTTEPSSHSSSTLARFPGADLALYSSSKAALECLTRHWALELAKPHNLTVNNVALGWIDTESTALIPEADREPLLDLPSAARRFGKVGEIADIVGFLASEGASWMNGDTVGASGGTVYM